MGNCLRRDSAMLWAGDDDWINVSQLEPDVANAHNPEKRRLLGEIRSYSSSGASTTSFSTSSIGGDQVKIKITKKELEELVKGGGNTQGLSSVEQLLARLEINGLDDHDQYYDDCDEMDHHRPWRPVLQSIPEVN